MKLRVWLARCVMAIVLSVLIGACGSGSGGPEPTPTPTPTPTPGPPPPPANAPPTITSLTSSSSRVEADETVDFSADVQDAETPVDQLTYEWSAAPMGGTFRGSGRKVTWQAPHLQPTPAVYTITLTVTEKDLKVTSSVQVHYNDSYREVTRLGTDFLVDKFGNYNISPQECVSNFSDSCPGKREELSQIQGNRQNFQILSATFSPDTITLNADKTSGTVSGPCVFQDIVKATGRRERVSGICTLTTVYENWQWYLCDSHFTGTGTTPLSLLKFRVPGVR
jgi:hypothetical protein